MQTATFYLSNFVSGQSSNYTSTTSGNAVGKTAEQTSSYSNFTQKSYGTLTKICYQIKVEGLPENAVVRRATCKIRAFAASNNNVKVRTTSLTVNDEEVASGTLGTTYSNGYVTLLDTEDLTLNDLGGTIYFIINFNRSNSGGTVRIYGATFTVEYEVEGGDRIYIKENGEWQVCSRVWKKENGVWAEQSDLSTVFDENVNYIKG